MNSIVEWPQNTIGMTPYMVHAHFLRRAFETAPTKHHKEFSPDCLYHSESVVPTADDSLVPRS